jgi:diacylglycerol kinase family enzyme
MFGKVAYWLAGFAQVGRPVGQLDAVVNRRTQRCGFALASRVKNYGGDLTIAANASLLESDFETVLFEGRNASRYLLHFAGVITGTLPRLPGVHIERTTSLELRSAGDARIYVQVDGEYAGHLPARIEIVESALTLLVPADARQRLGIKVTEALMPAAG